jgi:GT2 family glycosyltransferase
VTVLPDVSALIINYNGGDLLINVVRSLLTSARGLDLEVIVWDNASRDGSADRLATEVPIVRIVRSRDNVFFARATNSQLDMARGRNILLLNPDARPEGDAIRTLYDYLQANPDVGAVGPRLVLPNGSLDPACRRSAKTLETYAFRALGLDRLFPSNRRFGRYNLTYLDPAAATEVGAFSGACMLVRREALEQIGFYMDEQFRMYCEDEDWCMRLAQRGWRLVYNPAALVVHFKGSSSRGTWRTRARTTFEWHRSVLLFHRKHLARRYSPALNLLVYVGVVAAGAVAIALRMPAGLHALWSRRRAPEPAGGQIAAG